MKYGTIRPLIRDIRKGSARALAIAISIVENNSPLRPALLKILRASEPRVGTGFKPVPAFVIGVTGAAGAGKSTLIAGLIEQVRKSRKKAAVIATDPTSSKTGGAFLGDRVRMQHVADDPDVFIRSMASRGASGGVARAAPEIILIFRAAGYDFIFVETVGAGQLDEAVTRFADMTLLVLTPESGDEIQLMKAGLFELADGVVVNKADRPDAERMFDFIKNPSPKPSPLRGEGRVRGEEKPRPIFRTVAEERKGIDAVYRFIVEEASASSLRGE